MARETRSSPNISLSTPGPYLATVVGHVDPTYSGTLEVQLLRHSGNDGDVAGQLYFVSYLTPFGGQTGLPYVARNDGYDDTQKSYGFWMVPPDPGTIVMVMFIEGDPTRGFWMGCVQDLNMNFMMPGYAATELVTTKSTENSRVPVAEYNKLLNESENSNDLTQLKKPATPQEASLGRQGLLRDDIRGITTSSARREVPSAVFGISTPGPLDKLSNKKGKVGKKESQVDAYVSRLTGSSFVMDDGDSRWERISSPSNGPPEYADVAGGETGLRDRPHNELIRLRTRTGHQILLHNSEDLIYIGNARGTTWIELTSDGKIDIFAEDSISIHTKQDLNFHADRDINLEAGRNFNIKVAEEMHTQVVKDQILIVGVNQKIQVKGKVDITYDSDFLHHVKGDGNIKFDNDCFHTNGGNFNLKTASNNRFTAGESTDISSGEIHKETARIIHMNGPSAASAVEAATAEVPIPLKVHQLPIGADSFKTAIMRRIPTREPYTQHENLDPVNVKPENTDRDIDGRYQDQTGPSTTLKAVSEYWNKYSTSRDTFKR